VSDESYINGTECKVLKFCFFNIQQSSPSSADVKECVELYLQFPNAPSRRGAQLKQGENFTNIFTLISNKCNAGTYWLVVIMYIMYIMPIDVKHLKRSVFKFFTEHDIYVISNVSCVN